MSTKVFEVANKASPQLAVRDATTEERHLHPVKWWATAGVISLVAAVYVFGRWLLSGHVQPTPHGPTPLTAYVHFSLVFWQAVFAALVVAFLGIWLIRPWLQDRRLSFDGLLILACATLYWQDPLANLIKPWFTYNSYLLQFGSWSNYIPGWGVPRGGQYVEPLLFSGAAYVAFWFPGVLLSCFVMRRAKARWPKMGKIGLLVLAFAVMTLLDIAIENLWLRSGIYAYPGAVKGLTLFYGRHYALPLYEPVVVGAFFVALAAIRFFRDDKGRSQVERGLDDIRVSRERQTFIRFLALTGFVNVLLLVIFQVPMVAVSTLANDNWPADVVNRSYFTSNICGPSTPYHCPSNAIPNPQRGSGYVTPDGLYVPASRSARP